MNIHRLAIFGISILAIPFAGTAAPICVSGTLDTYVALASGGCMIGTSVVSNFSTLPVPTGSTAIPPSSVLVTPADILNNPTLTFGIGLTSTTVPRDIVFGYNIAAPSITGASLSIVGSATGNGAASGAENFCLGGNFAPNTISGCTSARTAKAASAIIAGFSSGPDSAAFVPPTPNARVIDDFTADPGGAGSATLTSATNSFTTISTVSAVPEPATMLLLASGVLVGLMKSKRRL